MARRKLFCEYGPVCYQLSLRKEWLLRHTKDLVSRQRFTSARQAEPLPALVKGHCSVIRRKLGRGIGGGLCQLANLIHWLVLNSPLTVTELHHHSDALFPDERRTVPFGTGTSVFYNNVDYRFRNDTDQPVQLLIWLREDELCGELRSLQPFPCRYRLVEENSHYARLEATTA